ncbi:MAG: ATP phosphoribosyltransferase regulatory subunit [Alphaproteobacteria bacterium]|nr:ATP phosphoribosyltransferase regulatory subunit [Alphaproteobacteria bacterium]
MTGINNNPALLPKGFADLLPPEAEGEARSILTLMKLFKAFGYERVKPPLVEFEDSLIAPGPGVRHSTDTFRVMDPLSHRMLGLRSDMTAQIARLVTTRFDESDMPIRMAYAGDVLRTKGSQLRTSRQFCQAGCEIITNKSDVDADIEICVLSIMGLKALDIKEITLDLNIPGFVDMLTKDVDEDDKPALNEAIDRRDQAGIKSINFKYADEVLQLIACNGDVDQTLKCLGKISKKMKIKDHVAHIDNFSRKLRQALEDYGVSDVSVSIDVLEQSGFEYHNTIGFTLFSPQVRGELGRGGAYDVCFKEENKVRKGHGFTLYMDTISRTYAYTRDQKKIFAPYGVSWGEIKSLQEDGWTVIRGFETNNKPPQSCSHTWIDGQITPIG